MTEHPTLITPVKDTRGSVITGPEEQLKRWQEHYHGVLNRPPPTDPPNRRETSSEHQVRANNDNIVTSGYHCNKTSEKWESRWHR